MKTTLCILMFALALPGCGQDQQKEQLVSFVQMDVDASLIDYAVEDPGNWVRTESGEFRIAYADYDGQRISLVNKDERLALRVRAENPFALEGSLAFLKHEVERLTSGETVSLGVTEYSFRIDGAPLWAPQAVSEKGGVYVHLFFAQSCRLDSENNILAKGYTPWVRDTSL